MLKCPRVSTAAWLAAALTAAAAVPAMAQTTMGELTVTGRYGADPNARTLSAPVSYSDLDLTTQAGQAVLQQRVEATAQDLCRRLGEDQQGATTLTASCERDAMASADEQKRIAIANATPRPMAEAAPEPAAPSATTYSEPASATVTVSTVTNGPVPDTAENRRAYGGPMSAGGRRTAPKGD